MTHLLKIFLVSLLLASVVHATTVEPIWLSPADTTFVSPADYTLPEQGVWTKKSVGIGGRGEVPTVVMDSKKTLWIMHGTSQNEPDIFPTEVWNYDPKTDLYRWVAGSSNTTAYLRNPGQLRVPSKDNFPGGVNWNRGTIDHNDNIWFMTPLTTLEECCELWMFNTTSFMYSRMSNDASQALARIPNYGTQGVPSDDVQPGETLTACLVTDSQNNLWLVAGYDYYQWTNKVWHFNTTSFQWTFISGNITTSGSYYFYSTFGNNPFYGGRKYAGCDIDENERVWFFGGSGPLGNNSNRYEIGYPDIFSDVWSYDTRNDQWQLEYGSDANFKNPATIVSDDFAPGNMPPAKEGATMVDRKDGTLMVMFGYGYINSTFEATQNDVWLFNKTSKQWKLVYGDPFVGDFPGNFTHYRTPGSAIPSRYNHGAAKGLNVDGDVFIYGGQTDPTYDEQFNDIWWIPRDGSSLVLATPSTPTVSPTSGALNLVIGGSHLVIIVLLLILRF